MKTYKRIIAYIPHSSIENYEWGWNNIYQTATNNSFQLFKTVKQSTDWHIDLLFGIPMCGVEVCRFPYSPLFIDVDLDGNDKKDLSKYRIFRTDICTHEKADTMSDAIKMSKIYYDFMEGVKSIIVNRTLILDCQSHSWKYSPGLSQHYSEDELPDVILSYHKGVTKPDDELVEYIAEQFGTRGYKVETSIIETPDSFEGDWKQHHDRLKISLKRACYMDEDSLEPIFDACVKIREILVGIYRYVIGDNSVEDVAREFLKDKKRTPVYEGVAYKAEPEGSNSLPMVAVKLWNLSPKDIDTIYNKIPTMAITACGVDRIDNGLPGCMRIKRGIDKELDNIFFDNLEPDVFLDVDGLDTVELNLDYAEYQYRFSRMEFDVASGRPLKLEVVKITLSDEDYIFLLAHCVKNSDYSLNLLTQDNPRLAAEISKATRCCHGVEEDFAEWPYLLFFDEAVEDAKAIRELFKNLAAIS